MTALALLFINVGRGRSFVQSSWAFALYSQQKVGLWHLFRLLETGVHASFIDVDPNSSDMHWTYLDSCEALY